MSSVTGHAHGSPPAHSSARSAPENAATTPSPALAASRSTPVMRARGYGLRTTAMKTVPGSVRLSTNVPRPRRSEASSLRLIEVPTTPGAVSTVVMTPPRSRRDGPDDVVVPGATAEVALEPLADRRLVGGAATVDEAHRRHHHAGRAVAALQCVVVVERLLHRMQLAVPSKAFDRRDLDAVRLDAEHRAGLHRLAVHEHGAGSTRGRVTPDVRPREPKPLAEDVDEELTWLDFEVVLHAVYRQRNSSHRLSSPRCPPSVIPRRPPRHPGSAAALERALDVALRVALGDDAALVGRARVRGPGAISTFTRPSLKYIRVGTSVRPFSRTLPLSESISLRCRRSLRSRSGWWPSGRPARTRRWTRR